MKRGLIRHCAVVGMLDPPAVTQSIRRLRERTGEKAGVYVIVEVPAWCPRKRILRALLAGMLPVTYIGGSNHLRTRVTPIARGLSGGRSRHDLIKKWPGFDPQPSSDRIVAILIPFASYDSLEDFLLHSYDAAFEGLPIGNDRIRARSTAANRPPWIALTWGMLFATRP